MAASVVRDRITWPQGSISHETAQFGRFTNLHVMPRITKNEAYPNALRTRQPVNHSPATIVMKIFSLGGTAPAPPPHYVDFGITTFCANRLKGTDSLATFTLSFTCFSPFFVIFNTRPRCLALSFLERGGSPERGGFRGSPYAVWATPLRKID